MLPTFRPTCCAALVTRANLRTALAGPWRNGHGPSAAQQILVDRALVALRTAGAALKTADDLHKQPTQGGNR